MNTTSTTGTLCYLAASVEPSLYRNGKVFIRRDKDGSDSDETGATRDYREMPIHNARVLQHGQQKTLAANGFELLDAPGPRNKIDFFDHQQVVKKYYPECAETVRQAARASRVYAFDHNIRWASGKQEQQRIAGGQQVQQPIHFVHGDYTLSSAPQRLRDLGNPPTVNDTLRTVLGDQQSLLDSRAIRQALDTGGRFAIINLWRNIDEQPVLADPLALCDGQSVELEDLVVFEIYYADRVGENYFARHSERHAWWYYPEATHNEAILIKQWDSAGVIARSGGTLSDSNSEQVEANCTFSFHSAFSDPHTPPDAPERRSIEVRCVVLYD